MPQLSLSPVADRWYEPLYRFALYLCRDPDHALDLTPSTFYMLNVMIDWELFRGELKSILGYDRRDRKRGRRPSFDAVLIWFLQFLVLQAGDDVRDARTNWDFKQMLEKEGRYGTRRLFKHFRRQLRSEGLMVKEGSMVDASFVDAPRKRNNRKELR